MRPSTVGLAAALLACSLLTGCSSAAVTTARTPSRSASSAPDPLDGFAVPLRVDPPVGLALEIDEPRLVTWKVTENDEDKIRIMAPATVEPNGAKPTPAPGDYHAYLLGLAPAGARITEDSPTKVDGVEGHLFTVTSTRTVDAGLGCWSDATDGCFGLPPDLVLRMATFTVQGRPVALWARTTTAAPNTALFARFERMLRSVRFER